MHMAVAMTVLTLDSIKNRNAIDRSDRQLVALSEQLLLLSSLNEW